ncbi:MAG: PPC domain-containing protein [Fimbriiglobus sp.]|nr:PPC domain-containing protein [Fimbriiglobus sp.]
MTRILFSLCALCALCGELFSASPVLSGITPAGAQRGTEATVTFTGARLADAQEVLVYQPGITVKAMKVVNDASVSVTFTIAPDCRLGEFVFRVRTASGISDARTFWVGALPVVDEKEPNSEFATPQPIPLNSTVHGSLGGEDVDYFIVECKKGQRLSVEVEGMRLARGFWDPFIAILNDKRFELATSDDSTLTGQDGRCSVIIPADGKYTVMVREASFGGGPAYRLHVGNFPLATAVIPAGGRPNEEIEFTFLGDPAGPFKQKIKLPATADENFRLHCTTPDGIAPTGFRCSIADVPNVIEDGNNLDATKAIAGPAPGAFHGIIAQPGQNKFFKFAAKKGQVFDIHCHARKLGSPLDPVMHITNFGGAYITGNDDSSGPDSYFRFTVPEDKEYALYVHDHLRKGGPDYFFRIEITPVVATTSVNIPKVDGNNVSNQDRQNVTVPKGGRYATLVNVQRADWGGPATLSFPGLPVGITPVADVVDPGFGTVPVVFEAKPDAAHAGGLLGFAVTPVDANVKAASGTRLDVNYNIGLNNTPFHRHFVDRIAVAVTDAAPYSIEVLEPKAGIPQNSAYYLRVVAKRDPSFKGPITVYPLFTPPGMGIAGSATIAPDQTETTLAVNAAPNAAPRKWKTAITAVADAGKGPVWTSSQLFTLEVVPPMVTIAQERAAVEQGAGTQVFGKVNVLTPFVGEATVKLIGVPAKVTAPDVKITKDSKEFAFAVTTDKSSPAGKHGTYCQVVIVHNGETLYQTAGGGELRIDVPLPPKVAAAPTPTATPMPNQPAPPAKPPEKRLTRLEQLRLEQEEREKAAKGGTEPKK